MSEVRCSKAKFVAYVLVRDKNGKPKFDDINNIPGPLWAMLTETEKQEIENVRNTFTSTP